MSTEVNINLVVLIGWSFDLILVCHLKFHHSDFVRPFKDDEEVGVEELKNESIYNCPHNLEAAYMEYETLRKFNLKLRVKMRSLNGILK